VRSLLDFLAAEYLALGGADSEYESAGETI
jgi:hypothetical protein